MNKEKVHAKKLFQIASVGFYLAALGFFAAGVIGKELDYCAIGAAYLSLGSLFLVLSRRNNKNDDDSKK